MSVLFGLLRKQKFHFIHAYKEEAFTTVKEAVKEVSSRDRVDLKSTHAVSL